MTSILAPQGVGLWGQNLRFTGAVGVAPAIPSDAYNRNSIGQRGGSVVTPIADVVGAGPSSSSRDPFNKQAATLIIRDEPKPRTLRDGFSGGEASFERGGIVTPIARTTLTEPEIKARLGSEGKSTRPASATPISLNDAIAMLRTAEETWPASVDGEPEIDDGYKELVSDAKRLKIIKGASMRRPITDEEQTAVTQIASKYASALGELSSDAVGVEAAAAAEDARPANELASARAAAEDMNNKIDLAQKDVDILDNKLRVVNDQYEVAAAQRRRADNEIHDLRAAFVRARGNPRRLRLIENRFNEVQRMVPGLNATLEAADLQFNDLNRARVDTMRAADGLNDRFDELITFRPEPSRTGEMRAESTARFAPHDRERARQAATMRGVMAPQFEESRRHAADLNTINRMQAIQIGTDAHDQRAAALQQAEAMKDNAVKQRADIANRIIDFVGSSAEETRQLLDDGILSAREDIAEGMDLARSNQGDIIFELNENYEMGRKRDKAAAEREDAAVTRGNEVAAMEGRMATRYAQEQKTMREELIEPYTQMGSRLGAIEKSTDVNARSGLQTMKLVGSMASSLLSTAASPVTVTIQEGPPGQRGASAKPRLIGEWTAASVTDAPTTTTIHTPTLADGRRG